MPVGSGLPIVWERFKGILLGVEGEAVCAVLALLRWRCQRIRILAIIVASNASNALFITKVLCLQNLCGVVTPRSVGSTPAPLR